MNEILTTARDLELQVNEDDIEEIIMGHEDELTIQELQEILNEEHQETQRNVSPSKQEEDERGPMPTSAIKDLLKKWEDVRAVVLNDTHTKLISVGYTGIAIPTCYHHINKTDCGNRLTRNHELSLRPPFGLSLTLYQDVFLHVSSFPVF
ncbi:uncharacterized protein TNCV_4084581 [Trichonephila clavipes]|nr:uncharacterized protein TNCV_4084581 [Trichonephila clavipes]